MSAATIEQIGPGLLQVSGVLDFHSVPDIYGRARQLLASGSALHMDLSRVDRADSAALVLLLEWLAEAHSRGSDLTFLHIPQSVMDIARVSNVLPLLEQASGAAAA